jgi:hypothetical protein
MYNPNARWYDNTEYQYLKTERVNDNVAEWQSIIIIKGIEKLEVKLELLKCIWRKI